jgi:peptidoglycan/LPS O-acetylase OafA/YrhL
MVESLGAVSEGRNNSITFFRLIAALAVIFGHSYAVVDAGGSDFVASLTHYAFSGGIAVDFFFLLSGFLVTSSILKRGVVSYVISRALRLFPALWVSLAILCLIVGPIVTAKSYSAYFSDGQVFKYFWSNGFGWSSEWFLPGVFEMSRNHGVNGSIWSVIIEMRLYCYLAAIYVLGGFKSKAIFNTILFFIVVAVFGGVFVIPGVSGETDQHVALLFGIGSFLYVNRDKVFVTPMFALFVLALCAITIETDRFKYAYVLLLTVVFCFIVFNDRFSWADKFGDYSYGIYLWGWPIQQVVVYCFPKIGSFANSCISMVMAIMFGALSWYFIEKPCLGLKSRAEKWVAKLIGLRQFSKSGNALKDPT